MFFSFIIGFMGIISGKSPQALEEYFEYVGLPLFPWFIILAQILSWTIIFCLPGYFLTSVFWPELHWPEKSMLILVWGLFTATLAPNFLILPLGMEIFAANQHAFDLIFTFLVFIISLSLWIIKKCKS